MDNFYHHESKPLNPLTNPKNDLGDRTGTILSFIGKGLIFAFFMPILAMGPNASKLVFPNFLILGTSSAAGMLKFQAIYPLLAGIAVMILAKRDRSYVKAAAIMGISVLPFLVLLADKDVRTAFSKLGEGITGGFSIQLQLIISTLAIFMILATAHILRVEPKHRFVGNVAVISGYLYFLSLLIPAKGKFVFLEPIKILTSKDPSGAGIFFVSGLASLIALALMIYAAVMCFQIQKQEKSSERVIIGGNIIRLWVWHLIVYGAAVYYMILISLIIGAPMGGALFVMFTMALIKFVPWILGLYVLIPLAIAEFILLKDFPQTPQINS